MSKTVLDASAILALLNQETGHELVLHHLKNSIISAVNFAEVLAQLRKLGIPSIQALELMNGLLLEVVEFDQQQAQVAAELKLLSAPLGLSLGDCACLALAKIRKLEVLTADQIWKKLNWGIQVKLIR